MAKNPESTTTTIKGQIQAALAEAHAICDQLGSGSKQRTVAWETVEELKTETSDQ